MNNPIAPSRVAVFLCITLIIGNLAFLGATKASGQKGVLGGPEKRAALEGPSQETILPSFPEVNAQVVSLFDASDEGESNLESAVLRDVAQPLGDFANQVGVVSYVVKKGDTLSGIAKRFGISVQTLIGANPKMKASALQIGQTLTVLPVSGVVYYIQDGETLSSVASRFGLTPGQLRDFNHTLTSDAPPSGTPLVIPGVKPETIANPAVASLPSIKGYFVMPTEGFNWGKLHDYNAVDIANNCGTPVVASAEGLVVDSASPRDGQSDQWNGGYGYFVFMEHPNGTKTRYAHLQDVLVSVGDYVKQSEQIGVMGNTGNVQGHTGCHLHFEVHGAQNPFAK